LAGELVEYFALEPLEIQHPQGRRQGYRIADASNIALVVFMRAGLYVAEGIREVLEDVPVAHVSPSRERGLSDVELAAIDGLCPKVCVIIDSVINTGASLEPVLKQLGARGVRLFVLSSKPALPNANRITCGQVGGRREHPMVEAMEAPQ
jgi:uracil phosphoribosyltransferase